MEKEKELELEIMHLKNQVNKWRRFAYNNFTKIYVCPVCFEFVEKGCSCIECGWDGTSPKATLIADLRPLDEEE